MQCSSNARRLEKSAVLANGSLHRWSVGRFPAMRQQFVDLAGRVSLHAHEHVGQVVDRIDAVFLARRDERVEHSEVVTDFFVAEEQVIPRPRAMRLSEASATLLSGGDR